MPLTEDTKLQSTNSDNLGKELYVDISKPRWDQSTFMGRLYHFAAITDVRKVFASNTKLDEAKDLIVSIR